MSITNKGKTKNMNGYGSGLMHMLPSDILKIIIMILFVFPFYWMLITAFKTYIEAIRIPPTLWPENFTFDSFKSIFSQKVNLGRYTVNSIIISLSVITIQILVMVPAAYAFAKKRFRYKNLLFGIVLLSLMVPQQITYITIYLMMSKLKLIDSLIPQIIPFGADAFGIFLLRQSFKQVPDELIESAKLDNAGELRIITKIMVPMSKSTLFTVVMFSFIDIWNSYFWPLVMTNNDKYRPLTMYVERIKDAEYGFQWNDIMAANSLLVFPVIIVFLIMSKKIIEAFTYKGLK